MNRPTASAFAWFVSLAALVSCASPERPPADADRSADPSSAEPQSPTADVEPSGIGRGGEDTADQTVRLAFDPGTSRAVAQDTLGGPALHDYLVRASAGQTLTACLTSDGPPTILVIDESTYRPDAVRGLDWTRNEARTERGASAGWLWQGTLPHDGDYRIRVAHSGPAVNGGAWSPYALTVEIQ